MRTFLAAVLVFCLPMFAQAQAVVGTELAIGTSPSPPSGSSVSLRNLGTSGGSEFLVIDTATFSVMRRVIAKADLPATVVFTDQANTFGAFAQTFGGQILASDGASVAAPGYGFSAQSGVGIRRSASNTMQFIANSSARLTIDGTTSAFQGAVTIGSTLSVGSTSTFTGLASLNGGFTSGANSQVNANLTVTGSGTYGTTLGINGLTTMTGGFVSNAAGQINGTLGVTGLTTLANVKTTGLYGVANPLTFLATDGVTQIANLYDNGRSVIKSTGNDAVWEMHATGNPSGSRVWRAGNIGGSYLIQSGNDAASVWTNLARSTMSAGVPDGWYWGTGVRDVNPDLSYQTNLGALNRKYLTLHAAELWVETLVAQDTIATIGGRILVGPTTKIEADLLAASTSIQVEHNQMQSGDRVYMEANGKVEFMAITSGSTPSSSTVSWVGGASAAAATVTLPAHQVGDLILIYAWRSTTTAPTLPAGYTTACTASGSGSSYRIGYKVAASTSETSGTWTNATHLIAHVYRGHGGLGACNDSAATASTTLTYPALTLDATNGASWVARFGSASAASNVQTVPSGGYTFRQDIGAAPESAGFDSNGMVGTNPTSTTITVTSGNNRGATIEIRGSGVKPFTYTVTRNLDGSGANDWFAGDAMFNTGQTGNGFIDIYSVRGVRAGTEIGPTIAFNRRNSATYNDWSTYAAAGNLRGLCSYGATDVYGFLAGNCSDVWLSVDATNGVRFFEAGTTQNALFALDGSILLGRTGAGQGNTYIDPSSVRIRYGTIDQVRMTSSGIQMFDIGGTQRVDLAAAGTLTIGNAAGSNLNTYIDNGVVALRRGTSVGARLTATTLELNDSSGTTRALLDTNGLLLGLTASGNGNIYADTSGNLFIRNGTTARIQMDAGNGALRMFKPDATQFFQIDGTSGLYLGNWYTSNKAYLHIPADASSMSFCRAGSFCPLVFNGTNGDITSFGNILLSTGGNIESTGNWTLTQTGGLRFVNSSSYEAAKSVQFYNASTSTGSRIHGNGVTNQGMLTLTANNASNTGSILMNIDTSSNLNISIGSSQIGGLVQVYKSNSANSGYLGTSSMAWDRAYVNNYYAGTTAGLSTNIYVYSWNGAVQYLCQMNFLGGIFVNHNCSVAP